MAKTKTETARIVMTPQQVETMAITIWGSDWRTRILGYLGISYSQLHRYMTIYGGQTIPRPVALALHYAHDSVTNDKPLPNLPEFPATEAEPVKFVAQKKPKPVRIDNDAPEIDIFAAPVEEPESPMEEVKAETPAPSPDKPKAAPKRPAKPKEKAPAKPAPVKKTAPAKTAKPPEKKKPARRAAVKKD